MVQHEHLIYGGQSVVKALSNLFNLIVKHGKLPNEWKYGLVVPILKGGDKSKRSPDNYRPISLLSCVLKVFEHIIRNRLMDNVFSDKHFPNSQQQGFQKHLSCMSVSFNLHETIFL